MVSLGKDGTGVAGMDSRACSTDDGSLPEMRKTSVRFKAGVCQRPVRCHALIVGYLSLVR